jgi:hypothetical protein
MIEEASATSSDNTIADVRLDSFDRASIEFRDLQLHLHLNLSRSRLCVSLLRHSLSDKISR